MEFSCLTEVTTACKSTLICYVISDKVLSFQPTESAVPAEEGGDRDEQRCDGVHGDGDDREEEEDEPIRSFSVSCVGDEARCLHTLSPAPAHSETRLSPDTAPGRRCTPLMSLKITSHVAAAASRLER